jgi:hypothetical protein
MCAIAVPLSSASEKILKIFHAEFPEIKTQSFFDYGDSYLVYFKKDDLTTGRVYYDKDGKMTRSIRYYFEAQLNPFIKDKVNAKYKGKNIFGVTEIISSDEHFYQVILQDEKNWYTIESDDTGNMTMVNKLRKA